MFSFGNGTEIPSLGHPKNLCHIKLVLVQISKIYEYKIVIIFLPISLNI